MIAARKGRIKMEIDQMIEDLLNEPVVNDDNTITFTSKFTQLVHDVAESCSTISIVKRTQERAEEYAKDLTAEEVYFDMLTKIVEAPTALHMRCCARMLIPILSQKLKERGL